MKKISQDSVDFKRDELKKLISDSLSGLNTKMQQATQKLTQQVTTEMNNLVNILEKEVEKKMNEVKSLITPQQTSTQETQPQAGTQTASYDLPGVVKNSKKPKHSLEKAMPHPLPRDTKDTKELPAFWRQNYDYGESPYMNIEKLDKITDKPPFKKKKK